MAIFLRFVYLGYALKILLFINIVSSVISQAVIGGNSTEELFDGSAMRNGTETGILPDSSPIPGPSSSTTKPTLSLSSVKAGEASVTVSPVGRTTGNDTVFSSTVANSIVPVTVSASTGPTDSPAHSKTTASSISLSTASVGSTQALTSAGTISPPVRHIEETTTEADPFGDPIDIDDDFDEPTAQTTDEPIVIVTEPPQLNPPPVAGCMSLQHLQMDPNPPPPGDLPTCFCDEEVLGSVTITCLIGSSIKSLSDTLDLARKAGRTTIRQIFASKMNVSGSITASMLDGLKVREVYITDCVDMIKIDEDAFDGFKDSMESVAIIGCYFRNGLFPRFIPGSSALKVLRITRTGLEEIPDHELFRGLKSLQELDLSINNMPTINPDAFTAFTDTLLYLDLNQNENLNYTALEAISSLKELKNLTMVKCHLTELPAGTFKNLNNLENLDLTQNYLRQLDAGSFKGLDKLKQLILQLNLINNTESKAFEGLPKLERLFLGGNFLGYVDPDWTQGMGSLVHLGIRDNDIEELPERAFANAPSIKILDLGFNYPMTRIDPAAFDGLDELIELNLQHTGISSLNGSTYGLTDLVRLNLNNTQISKIGEYDFDNLYSIEELSISGCHIETLMPETFEAIDSLTKLDVSENPFYCDDRLGSFIEWIESEAHPEDPHRTVTLVNQDRTFCMKPEDQYLRLLAYVNVSELVKRVDRNDSYEDDDDWLIDDTTEKPVIDMGVGVPIPDVVLGEQKKVDRSKAVAAVIGALIVMVVATVVVVIVVVTLRVRRVRGGKGVEPVADSSAVSGLPDGRIATAIYMPPQPSVPLYPASNNPSFVDDDYSTQTKHLNVEAQNG